MPTLLRASRQYPVVSVTGPRQSGKTTLLRHTFPRHAYVSLEAPDAREFAFTDPRGFLAQFGGPVILDEAQHVPDLFSYIQLIVDEHPEPGRFMLSGSHNFLLIRRIAQSLAGRVHISHLLPFSPAELHGLPLRTADDIADPAPDPLPDTWTELAATGGYPPIHDRRLDPSEWLSLYFQTYLERDVRALSQVGDLEAFRRFVVLCAGRAGQLLNLSALGADCGVSHETARRWLSVLEASFIVFRLPPHHENFNKRLTKSPKLYFLDTGLLCYLLRVHTAGELATHAMRGAVFENFVITELRKSYHHAGREPRLSFWRDHRGNEVDLVVDLPRGAVPVEIKSGATIASDFFKGLGHWEKLAESFGGGILVYGGDDSHVRSVAAVRSWRHWP
ncbi:ATP-binding protein [Candidatus Rariloculus sp.]|uniref:ATP-binding protein n=1 Tax=Candidatus Rariloculus sp. TaxID=3101265 RepID=UPI003D10D5CA